MPDEEMHDGESEWLDADSPSSRYSAWSRQGILELLREESSPHLLDPKFRRHYRRYIFQALLATATMTVVLLFVDSLSTAAIAAGLGSSVVGIYINPSGATARVRAVIGGHTMALIIGSALSFILFSGSMESFTLSHTEFHTLVMAVSVGLLILVMAVTDTEHPPAAGIAIGMTSREWTPEVFWAILGALVLLGAIKLILRRHLRDLL